MRRFGGRMLGSGGFLLGGQFLMGGLGGSERLLLLRLFPLEAGHHSPQFGQLVTLPGTPLTRQEPKPGAAHPWGSLGGPAGWVHSFRLGGQGGGGGGTCVVYSLVNSLKAAFWFSAVCFPAYAIVLFEDSGTPAPFHVEHTGGDSQPGCLLAAP